MVSSDVGIAIHSRQTCRALVQALAEKPHNSYRDVRYTWGLPLAALEVAVDHSHNQAAEAAIVISVIKQTMRSSTDLLISSIVHRRRLRRRRRVSITRLWRTLRRVWRIALRTRDNILISQTVRSRKQR